MSASRTIMNPEQKRIVTRVEELLRWCNTLEAQLHQTRTLGAHLLAA
jgi:hypothetical protein